MGLGGGERNKQVIVGIQQAFDELRRETFFYFFTPLEFGDAFFCSCMHFFRKPFLFFSSVSSFVSYGPLERSK